MTWTVGWSERALKDARALERGVRERVLAGVERFATAGHGDVKRMQSVTPPRYRLRIGDWRVTFELDHDAGELLVLHVAHRREAYR